MIPDAHYDISSQATLNHPFAQVVAAHFVKFPDVAHVPEIVRADIVGRVDLRDPTADAANAAPLQFVTRTYTVLNTSPRVIKAFGLPDPVFFVENAVLDPNKRTFQTRSKNVSFAWLGECTEETEFADAGDGRTTVKQHGGCVCHRCGPVKKIVEHLANKFVTNGAKDGVAAFREYLKRSAAAMAAKKEQGGGDG